MLGIELERAQQEQPALLAGDVRAEGGVLAHDRVGVVARADEIAVDADVLFTDREKGAESPAAAVGVAGAHGGAVDPDRRIDRSTLTRQTPAHRLDDGLAPERILAHDLVDPAAAAGDRQ